MRTTKAAILALASILSCRVARGGQQSNSSPSQVVITVTDPSGAGVAHTPMRIVPSPNPSAKMETDDKGRVSLNMKPGGYAVFVRGQGFKASATHVDVTASKELQTFSIVLTIASPGSPMVSPVSAKDGLLVLAYPYHEPIGFSFAELKTMPRTTVTAHNPHANTDESYTGGAVSGHSRESRGASWPGAPRRIAGYLCGRDWLGWISGGAGAGRS